MEYDRIEIEGARENNLKGFSLSIPRRKLGVFTGVSGSGKSSFVFDTIAAEAQRQLNETFSAFARNRLPHYGRPDVDRIDNLSAVVVIDQKPIGGNARSTVGTITDIYAVLRLLYSRIGKPHAGHSDAFSFNDSAGMCPKCEGLGETTTVNLDALLRSWQNARIGGAVAAPLLTSLTERIGNFVEIGLGYLGLSRPTTMLSGGEGQRIKTVRHLSSSLIDMLYVFDDPTVGLHARDVDRLIGQLRKLRDRGNTVIVIEHNLDVIRNADWVIDLGPEGGAGGGRVLFEGTPEALAQFRDVYTAAYLRNDQQTRRHL